MSSNTSQTDSPPVATEANIQADLNAQDEQYDASSELSDPPPSPPATESDSDDTMASPARSEDRLFELEDGPDAESDACSQHDEPEVVSYSTPPRRVPLSRLRVHDIESELNLTRAQGDLLHDLMQSEMKAAGLLGGMNFGAAHKHGNEAALRPIFTTVKEQLVFLEAVKIQKTRLAELLWARAMILNDNEKHNRYMVKAGKVKMRADGTTYTPGEEEQEQDEAVQAVPGDAPQGVEQELPVPRRTSRGTRPSVIAAEMENMNIGFGQPSTTQHEEDQRPATPGSPMHIDEPVSEPARTAAPPRPIAASVFHPTAFIVRVVNQSKGAAVHTSQLLTETQQNEDVSVESLSYDMFITLVSQQVGFDVRGRISGVVPKFHAIAPIDMTVEIGEEATWRAVLQAWQNTRRKTCEFVVKADGVEA
tara:strand:- start:3294 stop:4556 length:1263 start_codon:yes stop_codon:yes gene_type:complete